MAQKNRADLKTQRGNTIYKNGKKLIKAELHALLFDDTLDSNVNWLSDILKLNIREYNNSLSYLAGVGVLYSGALYQANTNTGLGAFNVAHWDLISSGGGGSSTWKGIWVSATSYVIGEYVIEANNIYKCNTANSDVSFTIGNWDLVLSGNVTQTATTTDFTQSTPSDWDTVFSKLQPMGDEIGSRVRALETASNVFVYTIELYANTDSTVSNIFPLYGKVLLFGNVNKSSKVISVSYETSTDGGDTWIARVDFAALDTYLTSATTPTSFILVRGIFTFLGGYIGEQAITLNYTQA